MGKIYKIYRESNYIRVIDITTKELYNGAVKEVFVDKSNVQKNEYTLFNVKHFDETAVLAIGKILKEDGSAYSVSEWETFYTENTGNFNGGGTAPTVNTAFTNKAYSAIMNITYDSENPNFEIDLTGDLDLTVTGTSNGDSGMVNLYFSATETATLNGFTDLVVTGDGEMIPVYFIHDSDGVKWYNDVTGGVVDTSTLALQDGTILYHLAVATNVGTFSNVGNVCTGIGTSITNEMIGAKITKANGEVGIIATRTSDTEFTTIAAFTTNSINTAFEVRCMSHRININGNQESFNVNGSVKFLISASGNIYIQDHAFYTNNNIGLAGNLTIGDLMIQPSGLIKPKVNTYADDAAAAADSGLDSGYMYLVTGSVIPHIKP